MTLHPDPDAIPPMPTKFFRQVSPGSQKRRLVSVDHPMKTENLGSISYYERASGKRDTVRRRKKDIMEDTRVQDTWPQEIPLSAPTPVDYSRNLDHIDQAAIQAFRQRRVSLKDDDWISFLGFTPPVAAKEEEPKQ